MVLINGALSQRIIFAIFSEYFLKSEIYIVKFDYKQVNHKTDFYGCSIVPIALFAD